MNKLRVLIVDDEEGMRLGAERALSRHAVEEAGERWGFDCVSRVDGASALETLGGGEFDMVLLDYKLPDMDGIEILQKITASRPDAQVIMITAFASLEVAINATKNGAYDFLAKPFTPQELQATAAKCARHIFLFRKARQLEKEKREVRFQFISVLAHELKSPIAAVEGYLQIMDSRLKGNSLDDYGPMVGRSLLRLEGMRKMVMDLLDLTRIESGQKRAVLETVELAQAAESALEGVRRAAGERSIELRCAVAPGLALRADKGELEIILNNLLSNAVKYNKDGGSVSLDISALPGGAKISCADTGIGMSDAELGRLFGEFVRIKNEETKGILGSGLGLSILKKVSALYDGAVRVRSKKGEGTCFEVELKSGRPRG